MTRALGRSAPAGALTPSAYAAEAMRRRSVPALPQAGLARLLPVPSIEEKPADSSVRASRASTVRGQRSRNRVRRRAARRAVVVRRNRRNHRVKGFMEAAPQVARGEV